MGLGRGMIFSSRHGMTTHVPRADADAAAAATGDAHASPQVGGGFRHTGLEAGEATCTFRVRLLCPTESARDTLTIHLGGRHFCVWGGGGSNY